LTIRNVFVFVFKLKVSLNLPNKHSNQAYCQFYIVQGGVDLIYFRPVGIFVKVWFHSISFFGRTEILAPLNDVSKYRARGWTP